jgi:hypothetical protein
VSPLPPWVDDDVHFSDPQHRVWLRRKIGGTARGPAVFILHNPSIAGGTGMEDPTSRRGISFATAWECSDLIFVNMATGIATDADNLAAMADPIGSEADTALLAAAQIAEVQDGRLIAAWGAPKGKAATKRLIQARIDAVMSLKLPLWAIRVTSTGYPEHPLYLPGGLIPQPYPS